MSQERIAGIQSNMANDSKLEAVDLSDHRPSSRTDAATQNPDASQPPEPDYTAMFIAAELGKYSIVQFLLAEGADVNDGGHDGIGRSWSPLCAAAGHGHESTVKLLLDHGADIHAAHHAGWAPIHAASKAGHVEIVKLLLQRGANVMVRDNAGWTSLHTASRYGRTEIVQVLLEWGADVRAKDARRRTPMVIAIMEDHEDIVRLLQAYERPVPPPSYHNAVNSPANP